MSVKIEYAGYRIETHVITETIFTATVKLDKKGL